MISHSDSIENLDSRSDLAAVEDLYYRCWRVIEERSIAYGDDPMGKTGLYSRTLKIRGTRDRPVVFEEYELDHQLVSGLRKIMRHIAIQTGQWKRSKNINTDKMVWI